MLELSVVVVGVPVGVGVCVRPVSSIVSVLLFRMCFLPF